MVKKKKKNEGHFLAVREESCTTQNCPEKRNFEKWQYVKQTVWAAITRKMNGFIEQTDKINQTWKHIPGTQNQKQPFNTPTVKL